MGGVGGQRFMKSSNSESTFLGHPVQLHPTRIAMSVSWFVGQKKDVFIYMHCLKPQSRPKKAKLDIWLRYFGESVHCSWVLCKSTKSMFDGQSVGSGVSDYWDWVTIHSFSITSLTYSHSYYTTICTKVQHYHEIWIYTQIYLFATIFSCGKCISFRQPKGSYHFWFSEIYQQSPQMPLKISILFFWTLPLV